MLGERRVGGREGGVEERMEEPTVRSQTNTGSVLHTALVQTPYSQGRVCTGFPEHHHAVLNSVIYKLQA